MGMRDRESLGEDGFIGDTEVFCNMILIMLCFVFRDERGVNCCRESPAMLAATRNNQRVPSHTHRRIKLSESFTDML